MKRCHRFICIQNEPYNEFNFEKSLRKYERIPHKKVKIDAITSRQDVLTLIKNNQIIQQKISQIIEGCGGITSDLIHQVVNQIQPNLIIAVIPHEQTGLVKKDIINQEKVHQNGRQILLKSINDDSSKLSMQAIMVDCPELSKEVEIIYQNQNQSELIDNVNSESLQISQQKIAINKQQGGRFYISSSVSLSKRSIERLLKQKKSQSNIVDQLCKSRSYLQTMRAEIQERLKLYRQGK